MYEYVSMCVCVCVCVCAIGMTAKLGDVLIKSECSNYDNLMGFLGRVCVYASIKVFMAKT